MSQVKKNRPQHQQGVGGAPTAKGNGSQHDPMPEAKTQGPSGDHLTPNKPMTRPTGSHLEPGWNVPGTDKTSDKQGGTVRGHSRDNPTAGKSKSGSKDSQHPNVTTKRKGASGSYLQG